MTIQESFKTIPYQELHPDLQLPADHIRNQNMGRIAGSIFYPSISFIPGLSYMWIYTPFCVGVHHTSILYAYKAALETLKSGDIALDDTLNDKLKNKLANKKFSRFHVNYKGDLVLHTKNNKKFSITNWKGISLSEEESYPIANKLYQTINGKLPSLQSQISYFHLEEKTQNQIDKILHARQLRFKACIATVLVALTFGHIAVTYHKGKVHSRHLMPCILSGLVTHMISNPCFRVEKHTQDLWDLIDQKTALQDIVKPKHQPLYSLDKDLHLYVSTFGNIKYSENTALTLRKQHALSRE